MKDIAHDLRREAEAGLVQHHQRRARHQRAAHRQHLPLAAGQSACHLFAAFPQSRQARIHLLHGLLALGAGSPEAAEQQIVFDRHIGEQLAPFRHQAQPSLDAALQRHRIDLGIAESDMPARASKPMMALSSVVLPAPLEPITVTSAPFVTEIETSCTTCARP